MINLHQSPGQRYNFLLDRIQFACDQSNRPISEVTLLGATKSKSFDVIKPFLDLGLNCIGENYLQDAIEKIQLVSNYKPSVEKHFIGHLQTNKIKKVLENFDLIQSVDSIKLLKELNKRIPQVFSDREVEKERYPVFMEVNLSGDENKSGCKPDELFDIINYITDETDFIQCKGLMTISPLNMVNSSALHNFFNKMHTLFENVQNSFPDCTVLSMGMSDDFEIAIEEGSTMIRIGTLLFGSRP